MSQNDELLLDFEELDELHGILNKDVRSVKVCTKDVYRFSVNHENPLQIDRAMSFQDVKSRWFTNIALSQVCLSD